MDNLKKLKKSNEVYLVATYKFGAFSSLKINIQQLNERCWLFQNCLSIQKEAKLQ